MLFWVLYFAFQGSIIGSFLNVVVDRLPKGESLLGRSKCDNCRKTLSFKDLVPVLSHLLMGGKSRCCQTPISLRYSIVEASVAIIYGLVSFAYIQKVGETFFLDYHGWFGIIGLLILASVSVAISIIDFEHHIIPDSLQVILFVGALLVVFAEGGITPVALAQSSLVALPILLIYLATGARGMGYADIKLAFTLGLWLGLMKGLSGLYVGFILGAIYGSYLLLTKKAQRKSQIAFGPFLIAGAWIAYYFSDFVFRLFG